ncbi:4Fe-4S binding protein [Draconibacterium sp. IB214405]|uniref:4Fe-4S binding protein n=1 Tax=Draconibacterium sp. IB214405 TaxID=3097352 RepID=UPI002A1162DD|nr:4Fe-4S binding protein [Draconibacterium sp. IB214405]MDX8340641.1 4Fe-4S binding protein [Draconibacterium sp. IB214405]
MISINKKHIYKLFGLIIIVATSFLLLPKQLSAHAQDNDVFEEFTDDYNPGEQSNCSTCADATTCGTGEGTTAPPWLKFGLLFLAAAGGAVYITKKLNWKIAALLLLLITLGSIPKREACLLEKCPTNLVLISESSLPKNEEDEFEPLEEEKSSDEFETFSDDNEFEEFNGAEEFESTGNLDEFEDLSTTVNIEDTEVSIWKDKNFRLSLLVLALTAIAGILVRFKTTRKLKTLMLLGTIIYLGFINGACPCMISSFQNTIMYILGIEINPMHMLWFLGLIPLTYFFGKVWCGWVCHLGGLQEFIFRPGILKVLQKRKSQVIFKWIRISVLIILVVQIIITKTNIFIHYDPFKVAFNLFSANTLGYILLAILLLSSVLIYRPFCRVICPVGLILGWISHIPGASKLNKNESCIDCKNCSNACRHNAMTYENKKSHLDNEDCILCGDCMDTCKFSSLEIKGIAK